MDDDLLLEGVKAFENHLLTLPEFEDVTFSNWESENGNIQVKISKNEVQKGLAFSFSKFQDAIRNFPMTLDDSTHNVDGLKHDRNELIDKAKEQVELVFRSQPK